jgi:hypothetical protein
LPPRLQSAGPHAYQQPNEMSHPPVPSPVDKSRSSGPFKRALGSNRASEGCLMGHAGAPIASHHGRDRRRRVCQPRRPPGRQRPWNKV